jgi:hypothetical protein
MAHMAGLMIPVFCNVPTEQTFTFFELLHLILPVIFMSIPHIPGPYRVGLTYCKVPIPRKTYGTAKFKSSAKPAFVLEETAFQAFYPCDNSSNEVSFGSRWLDRCVCEFQ